MRDAICSSVLSSMSPCAAYWLTSSRICDASALAARRTVGSEAFLRGLETRRAAPALLGKLCMGNVYINIPPHARAPSGLVRGENCGLSVLVESQNLVRLGARSIHSRRAHWHAGNREAGDLRLLPQEPINVFRGNVTLDEIAVNDSRMTGGQTGRNSE